MHAPHVQIREVLEKLLDDDKDMRAMNLSAREANTAEARTPASPDPDVSRLSMVHEALCHRWFSPC